ncbi:unnamed protein product [Tilletia controversa]|uniref:Histone deacetylase domain-containing protein n=1 Tax=Tilletia caries TaxID=13290 RepID=A0ABN7IY24_9BASI|nr:unnamed protein product [Tilletia controversa]CAD6930737.1 unnamed protein product [Tilletia caries]CAD6926240.1 unnamed protein product [Tilletia controversa]CAD6941381.1 unnamed protein product [Tilletia controversa]CAD6971462.1 unnamed protein product [Tilletia controversa]
MPSRPCWTRNEASATPNELTRFHTDEYVDFLRMVTPETVAILTGDSARHLAGAGEDCPAFEGLWDFCSISAGGSIGAAHQITTGNSDISVNWAGGLHHAKKREASGFCYVNDIVLCILELLRVHTRVLSPLHRHRRPPRRRGRGGRSREEDRLIEAAISGISM